MVQLRSAVRLVDDDDVIEVDRLAEILAHEILDGMGQLVRKTAGDVARVVCGDALQRPRVADCDVVVACSGEPVR